MKLSTKIFIATIVILLGIIVGGYVYVSNLKATIQEQENTIVINKQNEEAYKNQIQMKEDSLQDYAIFVKDLQKDIKDEKKKYVVLEQKYKLLINSVNVIDSNANVIVLEDSIIKVEFKGVKGKVEYEGNTKYYVKTQEGTYSIEITIKPSNIVSTVYIDSSGIVRNEVYVDGALIDNAETDIDSAIFLAIKNGGLEKPSEYGFFDRLGLFADATYGGHLSKFNAEDSFIYFGGGLYYMINDNMGIALSKYIDDPYWYLTFSYYKSIREIFGGD